MVPVPLNHLAASLRLGPRELISIVGGGGKTTTLFALGSQLTGRVLLTTTTKMGAAQTGRLMTLDSPEDGDLRAALASGTVLVRNGADGHKAHGVDPVVCDRWFADASLVDHVVVEADGARRQPFKAPRPFEPVIPATTTTVLACIGADALGRVIMDQCFRPMRVAAVAGCRPADRLTPQRAAAVLSSERGSRKGVAPAMRFVVVVTKVEPANRTLVDELSAELGGSAEIIAIEYAPGA
ncbi:MAG: selenium cofactor biosynthesis protein YqeC [Ilumatobacter sp.]|uniref:selenium cofactor biosynthesis protein YqeC n=1 Tax=Ilumatobacter sp. TaxID=1967498 RepID=UPI00262D78E6|nr:selenium cofactor biosynthesis protein YqeC [Ilumatobacter sp.]MDJ0767274.1 selenium cofactor biosynthesis protein YqeC [Ilumatobacter sp.]